jgi:DNA ligase-1
VQSAIRGDWQGVTFNVFENPTGATVATEYAREVEQVHCFSLAHLQQFFDSIVSAGGEGVILRRGDFLEKFKGEHDEEATVIGYSGTGRAIKSLIVRSAHGEFCVGGLKDAVKYCPPAIGSLVTFAFQTVSRNGIPKCAKFLRVRDCLTVKAA